MLINFLVGAGAVACLVILLAVIVAISIYQPLGLLGAVVLLAVCYLIVIRIHSRRPTTLDGPDK